MNYNFLRDYPFVRPLSFYQEEHKNLTITNELIENAVLGVHMQYRDRMYITIRGKNFYLCDSAKPVGPYLGSLMTFLADFFDENQHGGFTIDQLNGKYIRLMTDGEEIIGFGHIVQDQFVYLHEIFGEKSRLWRN